MRINVKPVSTPDPGINELRERTAAIVNNEILPNEDRLWPTRRGVEVTVEHRQEAEQLPSEIKAKVKKADCGPRTFLKSTGGWGSPSSRTRA